MINKLDESFARLRQQARRALIPFVTSGYPNGATFAKLTRMICAAGADVLEIGFPHSDPLADGPVIQHSSHVAIKNGFTLAAGFAGIRELTDAFSTPIVVMCYSNLIFRIGISTFMRKCAKSGVSGLIVPDMIIEEGGEVRAVGNRHGIAMINLVTPTTPYQRAIGISMLSSGFIYVVSVTGTTGPRSRIDYGIRAQIDQLRKVSSLPICVGFGISSAAMAAAAAQYSDGVIIGSKILQIADADDPDRGFPRLQSFLAEVKSKLGDNL
jgi:tryptophan synthase alpha chain